MGHSSDRGQFEPVVALVAVLAVSAGLVTYADILDDTLPGDRERDTARLALDRVHDRLRVAGVVLPDRLDAALVGAPDGWQANATLLARGGTWRAGPTPPDDGRTARRRVTVHVGPERLRPGTLRVVVWR
jgi:hypothetical protein